MISSSLYVKLIDLFKGYDYRLEPHREGFSVYVPAQKSTYHFTSSAMSNVLELVVASEKSDLRYFEFKL